MSQGKDNAAQDTISIAYELGLRSVDISIRRFDNQDANLEKIITWVSTFTTALLTAISSEKIFGHISYQSLFFYIGVICTLSSLAVAFIGKFIGEIKVTNPKKLHEEGCLEDSIIKFKTDHIYYFGEDCDFMDNNIKKKWLLGVIAILLFSVELVAFVAWVVTSTIS
jgi:hypothetical protein